MSDEEKAEVEYDVTTRSAHGHPWRVTKLPMREVQEIETKRISIKTGNVELVLDGGGGRGDRLTIDGRWVPTGTICDIRLEAPCEQYPKLTITRVCFDKGE
jgi:hypothetical protein